MVAACDASDGSHWALQQWQRLWQNYGGDSARAELYISHWRSEVGTLSIQTDYSYRGRFQHLWGRFLYHGRAVFGTHHTLQGVPTDKQGRNIYVDYLSGPVWRRVNSFLTHPPTAGFCYTFANHPAATPAWNGQGTGDAYRATAIGPGVSPLVQTHFAPPGRYTRAATPPPTRGSARCSAVTVAAASTERRVCGHFHAAPRAPGFSPAGFSLRLIFAAPYVPGWRQSGHRHGV